MLQSVVSLRAACLPERSVTIADSCDMVMHISVSIVMILRVVRLTAAWCIMLYHFEYVYGVSFGYIMEPII